MFNISISFIYKELKHLIYKIKAKKVYWFRVISFSKKSGFSQKLAQKVAKMELIFCFNHYPSDWFLFFQSRFFRIQQLSPFHSLVEGFLIFPLLFSLINLSFITIRTAFRLHKIIIKFLIKSHVNFFQLLQVPTPMQIFYCFLQFLVECPIKFLWK